MKISFMDREESKPKQFYGYRLFHKGKLEYFGVKKFGSQEKAENAAIKRGKEIESDLLAEKGKYFQKISYRNRGREEEPYSLPRGISVSLGTVKKILADGGTSFRLSPCFVSSAEIDGKMKQVRFRTFKLGYHQAWTNCVNDYCKQREIQGPDIAKLVEKLPPPSVFHNSLATFVERNPELIPSGRNLGELLNF